MANLLLIVAAGSGTRLGRVEPKALVPLAGRPLLSWALDVARLGRPSPGPSSPRRPSASRISGRRRGRPATSSRAGRPARPRCARGFAALSASDEDIVAVHDAARPLCTAAESSAVVAAAERTGAAIAAIPVVDTIKVVQNSRVLRTVDRSSLWAAATPQAFRAEILRRALDPGRRDRRGRAVRGSGDSGRGGASLAPRASRSRRPRIWSWRRRSSAAGREGVPMGSRVGIGFDAHPFAPGRALRLGGVAIPHESGLEGHSDGDALLHALTDAVLGAAGLGSIGDHFPPTDPTWKGADSATFVGRRARARRARADYSVGNVDAVVVGRGSEDRAARARDPRAHRRDPRRRRPTPSACAARARTAWASRAAGKASPPPRSSLLVGPSRDPDPRLHPIEEAVRARPREIEWVLFDSERRDRRINALKTPAGRAACRSATGAGRPSTGWPGPGTRGRWPGSPFGGISRKRRRSRGRRGDRFLLLLDEVQDPQNLGAVLRVAEGLGAGVVVPGTGDGAAVGGRRPSLGRSGRAGFRRSRQEPPPFHRSP